MGRGKAIIIKLPGRIQAGDMEMIRGAATETSDLIFDLTDAVYLSAEFLDFLINVHLDNPGLSAKIRLLNPNKLVADLLASRNLTQLYNVEHIYPTAW